MWYNSIMKPLLRSLFHSVVSKSIMLVTYRGCKSGHCYPIPVSYVRDCNTLWTISTRSRTWWRNLRESTPVTLRLGGKTVQATGEVIEATAEVAEKLKIYLELVPTYAKYFGVKLDAENEPDAQDIVRAARERVMVRFELN